ncbi:hypothetical protein C943_04442 [Mariniradius saccharolyticus AK6]|uniref:Uncharacterized protein n=1 Tax=Mariniradius saccharolyticus AK6 TaxID=1239962 RepID=M7XFC1_9BACT|nr:hypothetical protein C943_04442 [Mariniradius saccharolyticus AK6]
MLRSTFERLPINTYRRIYFLSKRINQSDSSIGSFANTENALFGFVQQPKKP